MDSRLQIHIKEPERDFKAIANLGEIFGDPADDAERVPKFGAKVIMLKTIKDAQLFKVPKPDGSIEEAGKFRGVIVHFNVTRSWYEKGFDESGGGSNSAPDCYSADSLTPLPESYKPQAEACARCPRNRWATDDKGRRSKACSDQIELYLFNPMYDLPVLLRVSTMNRLAVSEFIKYCEQQQVRKELLIVELTLQRARGQGGQEYDALHIGVSGTISYLAKMYSEKANQKISNEEVVQQLMDFKAEHAEAFRMAHGDTAPAPKEPRQKTVPAAQTTQSAAPPKSEPEKPKKRTTAAATTAPAHEPAPPANDDAYAVSSGSQEEPPF